MPSDLIVSYYIFNQEIWQSFDDRKQIVIVGTESHICVLQTVLDVRANGYDVLVVDTGVGSRRVNDKMGGLDRMMQNGAEIITRGRFL